MYRAAKSRSYLEGSPRWRKEQVQRADVEGSWVIFENSQGRQGGWNQVGKGKPAGLDGVRMCLEEGEKVIQSEL